MKAFKDGEIVIVSDKEHPLHGIAGKVVRRRMGDDGAWVKMQSIPEGVERSFPVGDSRENHFLLYPEECERDE